VVSPLTIEDAEERLAEIPLVAVMAGSIPEIKALRARCLAAGIPALMGCPPGKSCGPRTHLLVEEGTIPAVAEILRSDWREALEREGLAPVGVADEGEGEHPPCPACGTAAPLAADGTCIDCGLLLDSP
jgi:hypothetical protein